MSEQLTATNIFSNNKFIPVIVLDSVEKAIPLANALLAGGVSIMEVTLRSSNALQIIKEIAHAVPEMTIGAGTVLNSSQYHQAIRNGAQFIVSPGLTADLVDISRSYDQPFIPGAITPSEIMTAMNHGFTHLKFFPASGFNALPTLKSLASVFPQIKFCPTGGIDLSNARAYLELDNVAGVGCSFIANSQLIEQNNFAEITQLARDAQELLRA